MDVVTQTVWGYVLGGCIILVYLKIKDYFNEQKRKQENIASIKQMEASRKADEEFWKKYEPISLKSVDGDEFLIGSRFLVKERK